MENAIELSNTIRQALGLAVQILEELPQCLRPERNIVDMNLLLAGVSCGRDGLVVTEAIATVLAFRTKNAFASPTLGPCDAEAWALRYNNRWREFSAIFEIIRVLEPEDIAMHYVNACGRLRAINE